MRARRIVRQSLHSGFFYALYTASRLLLAVALGKTLSSSEYGSYSLIGSLIALGGSATLSAFQYFVRNVPGSTRREGISLLKGVIVPQTALLILIAVLLPAISRGGVTQLIGLGSGGALFAVILAVLILDSLATEFMRYLYARKEAEQGNWVAFFQNSFWACALFLVYLIAPETIGLRTVLAAWVAGLLIAVAYGAWKTGLRDLWKTPWQLDTYRAALLFGLPFLLTYSGAIALSLGRFFLAGIHSTEVVGIFSYHYNIIAMIGALSSPLIGNPIDPYAIEAYNNGRYEQSSALLTASLKYRLLIVIPLLAVAAACSGPMIRLLAKEEFIAPAGLLLALAPIPLFLTVSSAFERIFFLEKRMPAAGLCHLAGGLTQIAAFPLLIPLHPFYGIAAALGAGLFIQTVLLGTLSRAAAVSIRVGVLKMLGCATLSFAAAQLAAASTAGLPAPAALLVTGVAAAATLAAAACALQLVPRNERNLLSGLIRRQPAAPKEEPAVVSAAGGKL